MFVFRLADFAADSVAEAAVVGVHDELTGQAVNAFVALKDGNESNDQVKKELIMQVRKSIGPFASPKAIFIVEDLPKTRSGKIMRRIMRKILSGEEDSLGDTSTVSLTTFPQLADGSSGPILIFCSSRIQALSTRSSRLCTVQRRNNVLSMRSSKAPSMHSCPGNSASAC